MRLGPHEMPNRLFVAPMAGVTDRPFRQLCRRLGAGYAVSEMITSLPGLWHTAKTRASGDQVADALGGLIGSQWSLATALSLLVWFVYAPQCVTTLAGIRREAGGWRHAAIVTVYLFALAWVASWFTYRLVLAWRGS